MAQKYLEKALSRAKQQGGEFWIWRLRKAAYVWEKSFLFPYREPENPARDLLVTWINRVLLFLAFVGMVAFIKSKTSHRIFAVASWWTIISVTLVHIWTIAEGRYSLPVYPLVSLLAANGARQIAAWVYKKFSLSLRYS